MILTESFLFSTILALSESMVKPTKWVTWVVIFEDGSPPHASTAPIIASLSPSGISPHVTTTSLKKSFGSGLNDRGLASLPLETDPWSHWGFMTGMRALMASWYEMKSIVGDIMCVNCSIWYRDEVASWIALWPPCSLIVVASYESTMSARREEHRDSHLGTRCEPYLPYPHFAWRKV